METVKTEQELAEHSYWEAVRIKLQKQGLAPEAIEAEINNIKGLPVEALTPDKESESQLGQAASANE